MYGNNNNINIGLPVISNTEPKSLSYFKYAKNAMRVGDLNPNYSAVQMPYHPYHQPSQIDPLYKSQDMFLEKTNLGQHPYLNSYPLPPIRKKQEPLKEIKSGELVDFPDETYIPLSKFVDYKNKKELEIKMTKEKEKAKEEERQRIELYGVNGDKKPSGAADLIKFHKKNIKHWKFMKNSVNIICGYLRMKKLAIGHKDLHAKRFVLLQSAKEGLATIRDFLLTILSNIEDFCVEFFRSTIIYNTSNQEKLNKSIFVTKSFIHQLFSDLTSALAKREDIPIEVKNSINSLISEGALLPYGFLSTFEFNRLEFTTDGLLTNMNIDRQGLLVCFIVLYRILLADIFKRYLFYFKKVRDMDVDEITLLEALEKQLEEYELRLKEKKERSKRKILKRGQIPGVEEEEDEEDKIKREKQEKEEENKIFEHDENEENAHREKENAETMGLETHPACPPKRKKKTEKSDSEENSDSDSSDGSSENSSEEENSKSKSKKSNSKSSVHTSNILSNSSKNGNKKSESKSSKNNNKKSESNNSKSKNIKNETKNSKNKGKKMKKTQKIEEEDNEDEGESEGEENEEKKIKGKEYGYSGYLNKKKGKYYHEKGIYFGDDREKGVNKDLLKEEERLKEEKLREKLENSNSSKSSIEEESEEDEDSEKKDKNKDKISSNKKSKSSSIKTSKKTSEISEEMHSSYKPKNINEEFWGLDLERKEVEERKKRENDEGDEEIDPLQERKNRIKKLPKEMRIKILEEEREKLKLKIKHNFHVVTNILHSILRDSMAENVPFYTEYYKEKFLFKALVFQKTHKQYSNGSDEIELSRGIIIDEESTEIFMTKNQRWAQMYKLLVFQFCRDFATKCRQ